MNCAHCGTPLPEGALFCGECGRSVGAIVSATVAVTAPAENRSVVSRPAGNPSVASAGDPCRQCGAPMSPGDIFCGECGSVSHNVSEIFSPRPGTIGHTRTPEPGPERAPEREPEPQARPAEKPVPAQTSAPAAVPAPLILPGLVAPLRDAPAFEEDLESTRIVRGKHPGDRFVLQFSTGESVTVFGSGLIGRNPHAEPGEHFDHIVRVLDATKSVSKTHVEFGQEAGAFWIKDRYSGNGTVIREPDTSPVRCLPDRRHRLARGSRVDIGEQFFVVS